MANKHGFLVVAALLAGCATAPEPQSVPAPAPAPDTQAIPVPPPPAPPPAPAQPPRSQNIAVAKLMETAHADMEAGRLTNAAASLERALRIEPRNPRLWQELARVRLKQGQYAQAESLALRSNSWAGKDQELRDENARIIAEARAAR